MVRKIGVKIGGGGKFVSTITEAIKMADNGDTIFVSGGSYFERIVIRKNITIVGRGKVFIFSEGGVCLDVGNSEFLINVKINNIMFRNKSEDYEGFSCVRVWSGRLELVNVTIQYGRPGVFVEANGRLTLKKSNVIESRVCGVYVCNHGSVKIIDSKISDIYGDGVATGGHHIDEIQNPASQRQSVQAEISGSDIKNCKNSGLKLRFITNGRIEKNHIYGNQENGIIMYGCGRIFIKYNTITHNKKLSVESKIGNNPVYVGNIKHSNGGNNYGLLKNIFHKIKYKYHY